MSATGREAAGSREAVAPWDAVGQAAWEGPGQGDSAPGRLASPHSSGHQAQQLEAFKVCP